MKLLRGWHSGADGFPRELYKYGVPALHVQLWRVINAYLRGGTPNVCTHEWLDKIASSIPKQLAALLVTKFRPIACICAKYSILLKILDVLLNHAVKDKGIIDDAQEAFLPRRSPKRQLSKVQNILHHQRKRQQSLSVILYLDIENAFNAINHRRSSLSLKPVGSLQPMSRSFGECILNPSSS